jgi:membrane-bound serine protease (ClpP class)
LLIVGGIIFICIELFLLPGFGVFGFTGIAMVGIGLVLAGQTFILPSNDYQKQRFVEGAGQLGLVTLSVVGLAIVFRKQIANSPMVKWLSLQPPATDQVTVEKEQINEELQMLVGWYGSAMTRCNPAGRALIGDRVFNVTAEDGWIDEGTDIVVTGKQGTTLVVARKPNV